MGDNNGLIKRFKEWVRGKSQDDIEGKTSEVGYSGADTKTKKGPSFMEKYSTEIKPYERTRGEKKMYYVFGDEEYEMPPAFSGLYFEQMQNGDFESYYFPALTTKDEVKYVINAQKMKPERLYGMLKRMINTSLNDINIRVYMISTYNYNTTLEKTFSDLTKQASFNGYLAEKLFNERKVIKANEKLEEMAKEILDFYIKLMSRNEQSKGE